jgi:hypothetical protein
MIQSASEAEWRRFAAQLSKARVAGEPVLPAQVPYQGAIPGVFDYVLPDDLLACLRDWLYGRGETRVLYFLTETAGSQSGETNFVLDLWDLNEDALSEVNSGFESVLTALDFAWALFVDHEGMVHVAGPPELYASLAARAQAGRTDTG